MENGGWAPQVPTFAFQQQPLPAPTLDTQGAVILDSSLDCNVEPAQALGTP
jgi:hypothetical protein